MSVEETGTIEQIGKEGGGVGGIADEVGKSKLVGEIVAGLICFINHLMLSSQMKISLFLTHAIPNQL